MNGQPLSNHWQKMLARDFAQICSRPSVPVPVGMAGTQDPRKKRRNWQAPPWRVVDVDVAVRDRQSKCPRGRQPTSYAKRTWPHISGHCWACERVPQSSCAGLRKQHVDHAGCESLSGWFECHWDLCSFGGRQNRRTYRYNTNITTKTNASTP